MLHDSTIHILPLPVVVPVEASGYDNTGMDSLRRQPALVTMGITASFVAMCGAVDAEYGYWKQLHDQV